MDKTAMAIAARQAKDTKSQYPMLLRRCRTVALTESQTGSGTSMPDSRISAMAAATKGPDKANAQLAVPACAIRSAANV